MRALLVLSVLALLGGGLAQSQHRADHKVKIAVYYESLCPDSKHFVTTQLAPVWRDLRGLVKVKMVPYGKSTHDLVDGQWQFLCHHGENECHGNKIQACILKNRHLVDTEKMSIIICLMNQTSPDKSLDTCMSAAGKHDESAAVSACAAGRQGAELLAYYGDRTDAVQRPLGFVPTVVINEKFDQDIQKEAMSDLKGVVCRAAPTKPSVC